MKVTEARIKKLEDARTHDAVIRIFSIEGIIETPNELKGQSINALKNDERYRIINIIKG